MTNMTIGSLARAGGVTVEAVRFYQRRGLIAEPERPGGGAPGSGIRRYGNEDLRRLRFVRAAQAAGFTLAEIGELLRLDATDDRARVRDMAGERIAALDARIAELQNARSALGRLLGDCESGAPGPCPILAAFDPPAKA